MPSNPREWTITGLAAETGIDRRTLGKLLADVDPIERNGRSYYQMRHVMDAIRGGGIRQSEAQMTRLLKNRADHEGLKVDDLRDEMMPASVVEKDIERMRQMAHDKFVPLVPVIAAAALEAKTLREIEEGAKDLIYGGLNELSRELKENWGKGD